MVTTLPQQSSNPSTAPVNGQPFNFRKLLDFYQLPRVIASDPKLPPGARLLWAVIYRYCWNEGRCTASDETLGRALAVSDRQFRRHVRALENAKLVQSTARAGKTTVRELVWDSRFNGKVGQGRTDMSGGVDISVRGGRTDVTPPYKEEYSSLISSKNRSAAASKNTPPNPPVPPAQKPAAEWTEEDYIARGRLMGFPEHVIQRDVERARARKAKPQAERMVKASELAPEIVEAIRR